MYIFIINPSFGYFVLNIFSLKPSIFYLSDFASIFSYYSIGGFLLIFSM
ncbi:MAG: hypothetical protein UY00_C0041G0011, partial [Candidatus Wolfebacteria bacterium GW2011_GWA1_47_6]